MRKLKPIEKIYKVFYGCGKDQLYFNQLKDLTGLSDSSLANALKTLKQNKEIESVKSKANVFYKLKNKNIIKINFAFFDYEMLENLDPNIKIPVRKFISEMPKSIGFIILFGSASRKQARADSDIDILMVLHDFDNVKLQREYEKELKKEIEDLKERINATSIYPINIFYTTIKEFKSSEDRLITEARNTGFCIDGNLMYYEAMLDE